MNVQDMGRHLVLDFVGVRTEKLDLNSFEQVNNMLEGALNISGLTYLKKSYKV